MRHEQGCRVATFQQADPHRLRSGAFCRPSHIRLHLGSSNDSLEVDTAACRAKAQESIAPHGSFKQKESWSSISAPYGQQACFAWTPAPCKGSTSGSLSTRLARLRFFCMHEVHVRQSRNCKHDAARVCSRQP